LSAVELSAVELLAVEFLAQYFVWRMISAQTRFRVYRQGKPHHTLR
jgi:hypothetical protein